jgi:hypothetical protein
MQQRKWGAAAGAAGPHLTKEKIGNIGCFVNGLGDAFRTIVV